MTARSLRSFLALAALLVAAPDALAAPPVAAPAELHGPVDPCTVASYEETDVSCEPCPPANEDSGACGKRLGEHGYLKKCSTHQAAAQQGEVWCKSQRVATAPKAKPEATQSVLRWVVLAGAAVLGGGLLYFRRERPKDAS